jgi:alcohol dehydrogenase (cytochrome c)
VFGPVANPYPDFDRGNPPDKDFTKLTDSVISVDTASGKLNWYYQVVPLDDHDYDLSTAPTLYRTSKGQGGRDLIALVGKFGRVFALDRGTHLLAFDTPATTLENNQEPLTSTWMHTCPGVNGGAQINSAAYHPGLGTLYVGMIDFCSWDAKGPNFGIADLAGIGGTQVKDWASAVKLHAPRGWITASDGKSGRVLWQHQAESQVQAGLVPTRSGLLFAGDTHGNLLVFNCQDRRVAEKPRHRGCVQQRLGRPYRNRDSVRAEPISSQAASMLRYMTIRRTRGIDVVLDFARAGRAAGDRQAG